MKKAASAAAPLESGDLGNQARLYQAVASRLISDIGRGRYPVGRRLPAERDLAAEHQVSRPTIREALIALEVMGLVEVRMGSGVYVRRRPSDSDQPGSGIGAFELTEARLLFEGEAAALAATTISEADLERLDELVARIAQDNARGAGEGPDREFHMLIARSTGNGAIARTIEQLWALRSTSPECVVVFARARRGGSKPVVEEHGAIVRALRARDPAAARGAMRAHLAAVIEHLLVTTEAEAVEQARETARTTRDRFSRAGRL